MNQIVFDGNSLTSGTGSTGGLNYPTQLLALLGTDWHSSGNFGFGGQTTVDMSADAATQIDPLFDSGTYTRSVLVAWEIRNDLFIAGANATDAYNHFVTYCQARRSAGWFVVALTVLPSTGVSDTVRLEVNANILANWQTFADALADVAGDGRIGLLNANFNPDYFVDDIHLNNDGYAIVANLLNEIIQPGGLDGSTFTTNQSLLLTQSATNVFGVIMASKYWVGGSDTWDGTAGSKWASTSGGSGGQPIPTVNDDVFLDSSSGTVTVTLATQSAVCRSLNCTGFTGTLAGVQQLQIGDGTAGAGNVALLLSAAMTVSIAGTVTFKSHSTSEQTITSNGKTLNCAVTFQSDLLIAGDGVWKLMDNLHCNNLTFNAGTLRTNDVTITCLAFNAFNTSPRTLTLGASTINCSSWTIFSGSLTFSAGTSVIACNGSNITFEGGGLTYNEVKLIGSGVATINSVNTFAKLTRIGTAVTTDQLVFNNNQIVTSVFTLTGNSSTNRLFVASNSLITAQTITNTGATETWSNVNLRGIALTTLFDASGISGGAGNYGNCTNILFTFTVSSIAVVNNFTPIGVGELSRVLSPQVSSNLSFSGTGSGEIVVEILADAANVFTIVQLAVCADEICPDIYGSVSRGNRYFDNRLRAFYWTDSCTEDKRKALIEATQIIDTLNFIGSKTDLTQLHQFPRTAPGGYCVTSVSDTDVPSNVEIAAYEIAIQLLSGIDPNVEVENLAAHSQGFSTARTTYERAYVLEYIAAGVPSARAWALLKPFLCDPGNINISRVN